MKSFSFLSLSLRPQAWKKRWFILRSGRMSGDPDVLEYYKSEGAKKPIRIIDLHCCEQVDAGLSFKRKDFQDSFVFDIKTSERTFYLVAETEEEMSRWVRSICQLCGFNQSDENHGKWKSTWEKTPVVIVTQHCTANSRESGRDSSQKTLGYGSDALTTYP